MSALRFVAWGMININDVEDPTSIEKAINEELEESGWMIEHRWNRMEYVLLGPNKAAPKGRHMPLRYAGDLKECCAMALSIIEFTSGGNNETLG